MKNIFIFIGFMIFAPLLWAQKTDSIYIKLDLSQASFSSFAQEIEQKTNYQIVYKQEWFEDLTITIKSTSISLSKAFKKAFQDKNYQASIYGKYIIILPKKALISSLPNFQANEESKEDQETLISGAAFMKGRKADLIKIKIGDSKHPVIGRKVKVQGQVIDAQSALGVEGATLYLEEIRRGTVSDNKGIFTIYLASGHYSAKIECLGMEKIHCQLHVVSDGSFSLNMQKANFDMKEIIVYGDRQMSIRDKDPGLEKVSVKSLKELPMMMGESDIIKISEMLPGVVSIGEGAAGLNVRGGSFDQNAFYFNNIPIYNTSHMFGFFPAFNADIISNFSIYKGYIPAKYGGKISSIFDIQARDGNKKRYTAHGGISPIAANITMEGPIKKDTASFLVSGRTSYSDWILKRVKDPAIRNSKASFYDLNASLNYDLPNTQINIFGYYSQDYFKLSDINTYWYSNKGVASNIGHSFNKKLRGDFSLSAAQYQFKTIDNQLASSAYEHEFTIGQYELKADFQKIFSDKHSLDFGINGVWYDLNRGEVLPNGKASLQSPFDLGNEKGLETALYISDSYEITPLLELNAGIRVSAFSTFGPRKVYTYYENGPKEDRNRADSINFAKGEAIQWYYFPEFRLALNYQTDEYGSIKLGFNQMHQTIFMLNNAITVAPNSQWKLADYHLKPSRSYQISLGVFRNVPKGGWEASGEVFYKNTRDYTEFKDGADFLTSPYVETSVLQGNQKSYGLEVLIKRNGKRLGGWLAYTYSRSLIQVDDDKKWNQINQGKRYPSNFDIPHVLNLMLHYHISKRVTLSTTITYQTGKPSTFPTSYYFIDGQAYLDYSYRNEYRIPDYFRTDASLTIEGNLRKKKWLHSSFIFSVYNLTSRENPYSVYFTKEEGRILSYQYAVIGVPILTATWIFKLGNFNAD